MKYIFVAGVPGSRWSSVVKNIYFSPSIDCSDYDPEDTYAHSAAYNGAVMHLGTYFDPGQPYGSWFDRMPNHSRSQCEQEFDRPFCGTGVKIIKSHQFCYHIDFLKKHWPASPVVMVYRADQASFDWWLTCGGFSITYPDYTKYYQTLEFMQQEIHRQNTAMMAHWSKGKSVRDNQELCSVLQIQPAPAQYQQCYAENDLAVRVY